MYKRQIPTWRAAVSSVRCDTAERKAVSQVSKFVSQASKAREVSLLLSMAFRSSKRLCKIPFSSVCGSVVGSPYLSNSVLVSMAAWRTWSVGWAVMAFRKLFAPRQALSRAVSASAAMAVEGGGVFQGIVEGVDGGFKTCCGHCKRGR